MPVIGVADVPALAMLRDSQRYGQRAARDLAHGRPVVAWAQ